MISGNYISGLVDGDGCFHFSYSLERKNRTKKCLYPRWRHCFVIHMSHREESLMHDIQKIMNCGSIYLFSKTGMVRYAVEDINDICDKVIPFFENNVLYAGRGKCFDIWKTACLKLREIKDRKRYGVGNKINITDCEKSYLLSLVIEMKKYIHPKPGRKRVNF